jgi:hypothetical protein
MRELADLRRELDPDPILFDWMEQEETAPPLNYHSSSAQRVAAMALGILQRNRNEQVWRVHKKVAVGAGHRMPLIPRSRLSPIYQQQASIGLNRGVINDFNTKAGKLTAVGAIAAAYGIAHPKRRNIVTRLPIFDGVGEAYQSEAMLRWGRKRTGEKTAFSGRVPVGLRAQAVRMTALKAQQHGLTVGQTAVGVVGGFREALAATPAVGYDYDAYLIDATADQVAALITPHIAGFESPKSFDEVVNLHGYIAELSLEGLKTGMSAQLPYLGFKHG